MITINKIAKICHEANRAFCEALGDFSQPPWEEAPDWQKSSAINGVLFNLDRPLAAPSASHDSWLKEKVENGWKFGPIKNAETKEHPCIVPFKDLPIEQQTKDHLFKAIVASVALLVSREPVPGSK